MSTERVLTDREHEDEQQEYAPVVDPREDERAAVTITEPDDVRIDRQPGSGSLTKQEAWVSETTNGGPNDGRSVTRTTFYARDADTVGPSQRHRDPEDRTTWGDLAKWNDGMWDPERPMQNFEADLRRWSQTFCNTLELTGYQTERVEYIVMRVDLESFKQHRLSAEKIILATISLVIDAETTVDDIEAWDLEDWIIYADDFEELMDDLNMDRDELWTARKLVHQETDFFSDD